MKTHLKKYFDIFEFSASDAGTLLSELGLPIPLEYYTQGYGILSGIYNQMLAHIVGVLGLMDQLQDRIYIFFLVIAT